MPTLYQRWIYCWPQGFIPWLINLQLFAHKLIKWLPGEWVWFFDNIMTQWNCFHKRYSMSRQKNSVLINEHALNLEPVPLITACKPLRWNLCHVRPLSKVEFLMSAEHLFQSMKVIKYGSWFRRQKWWSRI